MIPNLTRGKVKLSLKNNSDFWLLSENCPETLQGKLIGFSSCSVFKRQPMHQPVYQNSCQITITYYHTFLLCQLLFKDCLGKCKGFNRCI